MKQEIKYPHIKVKMSRDNSFMLIANVSNELKRYKVPAEERKKFFDEAMSGDYKKLLETCKAWVTVT